MKPCGYPRRPRKPGHWATLTLTGNPWWLTSSFSNYCLSFCLHFAAWIIHQRVCLFDTTHQGGVDENIIANYKVCVQVLFSEFTNNGFKLEGFCGAKNWSKSVLVCHQTQGRGSRAGGATIASTRYIAKGDMLTCHLFIIPLMTGWQRNCHWCC